jgi:hypothetical protein
MLRHPSLSEENITVTKLTTTETYETGKYEVRIEGFGDIPLLVPYYEDTLLCVPIGVGNAVINPPYTYSIPDSCDLPETSCQTGNILSRPCEGEGASDTVICCNQDTIAEDKNISSYLEYERDLFDPNRILTKDGQDRFITVGDLLAMKNLNRSEYVIYKQSNDKLVSVGFNETLLPGTRIVAVENTLNSDESINRIKNYINSKITVLPSRQV